MTFFPLLYVGYATNDETHIYFNYHFSLNNFFSQYFNSLKLNIYYFISSNRPSISSLINAPVAHIIFSTYNHAMLMRILSILIHLLNIIIFYNIVSKLFKSKEIGFISSIIFILFIQNSWEHNLLVSYIWNLYLLTLLLMSIFMFIHYLENGGKKYVIISSILLLCSWSYEVDLVYFPIFFVLSYIFYQKKGNIDSCKNIAVKILSDCKYHIIFILIYFTIYFFVRLEINKDVNFSSLVALGYEKDSLKGISFAYYFAIGVERWQYIILATYQYAISSLPTYIFFHSSAFLNEYSDTFYGHTYNVLSLLKSIQLSWLVKAIFGTVCIHYLLHNIKNICSRSFLITGIIISLYLLFAPALPTAVTFKYQEWVRRGSLAFINTYHAYYGMIIIITVIIYHMFYYINKINNELIKKYVQNSIIIIICVVVGMISLVTDYSNAAFTKSQIQSNYKWKLYDRFVNSKEFLSIPENSVVYAPSLFKSIAIVANFKPYWTNYTAYRQGYWINILNNERLISEYIKNPLIVFNHPGKRNIKIIGNYDDLKKLLKDNNERLYYIKYSQEKKDPNQYLLFGKVTGYNDHVNDIDLYADTLYLFQLSKYREFLVFGTSDSDLKFKKLKIDDSLVKIGLNSSFAEIINRNNNYDGLISAKIEFPKMIADSVGVSNYTDIKYIDNGLVIQYGKGIYPDEISHRWSDKNSEINIINKSPVDVTVEISFDIATAYEEKSELTISVNNYSETILVNSNPTVYKKHVHLKKHSNELIKLHSEAKQVYAPKDNRSLYFMIKKPDLKVIPKSGQRFLGSKNVVRPLLRGVIS